MTRKCEKLLRKFRDAGSRETKPEKDRAKEPMAPHCKSDFSKENRTKQQPKKPVQQITLNRYRSWDTAEQRLLLLEQLTIWRVYKQAFFFFFLTK